MEGDHSLGDRKNPISLLWNRPQLSGNPPLNLTKPWFLVFNMVYWLVIWNMNHELYVSTNSWEEFYPIWRTPSLFRGVGQPPSSFFFRGKSGIRSPFLVRRYRRKADRPDHFLRDLAPWMKGGSASLGGFFCLGTVLMDLDINGWLVVTGTMEFWMTFQKQLGIIIPTGELHHFSEG